DLDFDRRAPLMMRVEARPDEPAEWDSGPAPGPAGGGGKETAIPVLRGADAARSSAAIKAAPPAFARAATGKVASGIGIPAASPLGSDPALVSGSVLKGAPPRAAVVPAPTSQS